MPKDISSTEPASRPLGQKLLFLGTGSLTILVTFAVAYWFWAAHQMETGLTHWVEKQRTRGFEITHGTLSLDGFPFVVRAILEKPRIVSPDGWWWQTQSLSAEATPWSPLSMQLDLSKDHLIDGLPHNQPSINIVSNLAKSTAQISLEGELLNARLQADGLIITRESHHPLSITTLDTTLGPLRPATAESPLQEFNILIKAQDINHPELKKTPLGGPISQLNLDGTLYGIVPKDKIRKSLHIWRDTGGFLALHDASMRWGPLLIDARGKVALDNRLRPLGKLESRIEGADEVVSQLEKNGLINKGQSFGIKLSLAALGRTNSRGRHEIEAPLVMRDGWLSVGPITLFKLPPLAK
ncbi:DUF2125 domain-containing protein [Kiloniella antarctica]|uniref:DUF2125 domain-containing protein n=1 Tax=Kiloniella antarctica TaxID=1550907 RepID=A0ABW5BHW5_9PROT